MTSIRGLLLLLIVLRGCILLWRPITVRTLYARRSHWCRRRLRLMLTTHIHRLSCLCRVRCCRGQYRYALHRLAVEAARFSTLERAPAQLRDSCHWGWFRAMSVPIFDLLTFLYLPLNQLCPRRASYPQLASLILQLLLVMTELIRDAAT